MSKKRVHEIAKELKEGGVELDNKEVVAELVSLGYDVKSHSSSLDEDQAKAAVTKIVEKRRPSAAPPPVAPKGFVVRRRSGSVEELPPPVEGAPITRAPVAAPPVAEQRPATPAPEAPAEPPAASQPAAATSAEVPAPVAETAPAPEAVAPPEPQQTPSPAVEAAPEEQPAPVAAAPEGEPTQPAPSVPTATTTTPPAPTTQPAQQPAAATPAQTPPAAATPPATPPMSRPGTGVRPGTQAHVTVRPGTGPQGRPGYQGSRPPYQPGQQGARPGMPVQGRPGAGQPLPPVSSQHTFRGPGGVPHAPIQPGVDPKTIRPTATQAVVISRPLIQVRRVTPSSGAHKNIPVAPGRKAIGEVREFKVVPDSLGRGREFVDVSKRKDAGARKKTTDEKGNFTKQEITDLVWGRVALPIRGKKKKPTKKGAKTQITEMAEEKKVIKVQEGITVSDLAQRMGVKINEIIRKLMAGGKMATANQVVDVETAGIIASDYGWKIEKVGFEVEDYLPAVEAKPEDARPRPPVVTVMGHVDHGKTSLLDAIRKASVASGEAGGITQHVGAYTVSTAKGDITFLDTPGHEAFTSMRMRGANITDVVVLVVASDDGVMPQTKEAISHSKAAKVPIVVAINKMDLPGANPDRVKKDLATLELTPEEWGGETIMVPVSAKTKEGLDTLLENIALQAEILELKANPSRPAVGAIIEAKLEKGRGPAATVLVQEGTLRVGDAVVTGTHSGRIRMMFNSRGEAVKEVLPGYSAEVIGLSGVPTAGESIHVVADERAAKEIAGHRAVRDRDAELGKTSGKETLEQLLAKTKEPEAKELRVVIKADVQGSVEAVAQALTKLSTPKVKVVILHKAVGMVTETDVMLASASKGIVLGFNVKPESGSEAAAKAQEVSIQTYGIIYELIDGVRNQMEGLLEPIRTEKKVGRAEVRSLFNVPKLGTIAGSAVLEGNIKRNSFLRVWRENKQVFAGKIASLKRFKDDVREVTMGYECGIGIEGFSELKAGDIIEAYEIEETRPSLA